MWDLTIEARQAIKATVVRLLEQLRGQILQVVHFGPRARGDKGPWSDIDILTAVNPSPGPISAEEDPLRKDGIRYGHASVHQPARSAGWLS